MAIQQEPYFGSVTVHYNTHLKRAEHNHLRWQLTAKTVSCFVPTETYLGVAGSDGVERPCHAREEFTQRRGEANSIGGCRHQKHHIQTASHTHYGTES